MVLSNKKLKQKLRAELAESLAASVAKAGPKNDYGTANPDPNTPTQPHSLKLLLDSATHRPRLSKREKRRKTFSFNGAQAENLEGCEENNGGEEEKKENGSDPSFRENKRKRNREAKGGVLGSEENGVVKAVEKASEKKSKKKKKKKNNNKKKKAKIEEEKGAAELENEEQTVMETNNKNDSQADGNVASKVYVGGIPYYSTEDDIRSYFEGCGTITEVDCMTFPESGKFRGIAIISFKTEAAAKRALALNGADMGGLFLTIQPYKTTRANNKATDFAPEIVKGYNRIYVGNLSWDITEDKLRNFFSDCKIASIRFGMDKETGEFRGYAHVDFSDSFSLTMALNLDQKVVCGRPARIRCAIPMKNAGANPTRSEPVITETADLKNAGLNPTGSEPSITETADSNTGVTPVVAGKMKRRTCYECGEKGHISSDCPKRQTDGSTNGTAD